MGNVVTKCAKNLMRRFSKFVLIKYKNILTLSGCLAGLCEAVHVLVIWLTSFYRGHSSLIKTGFDL